MLLLTEGNQIPFKNYFKPIYSLFKNMSNKDVWAKHLFKCYKYKQVKKSPFVISQHHEKEIFLSFLHVVKFMQGPSYSYVTSNVRCKTYNPCG